MSAMNIVYEHEGKLYINVTNRCTNRCDFCIRYTPSGMDGIDLWLDKEPSPEQIIEALIAAEFKKYSQIVFCGYGEPLLRWEVVVEVARFIRKNSSAVIRINTNGHANHAAGFDITPEFEGLIDVVSISLNAKNAEDYDRICHCEFGKDGFDAMLDFAKCAKKHVGRVVLSVVDTISAEDIAECEKIAKKLGVEYRVRKFSK